MIRLLLINEIIVFIRLVFFEYLGSVNLRHGLYICMCRVWFTNDIVFYDINWYEMTLVLMIILIWDDVVIDDNNWWDNVGIYDNIDMRWYYYWWQYWYEMMLLLLIISLRWDDVVVDNDIEMRCCWCWNVVGWCMLCMYMGGAMAMMDISSRGNRVVK